MQLVGRFHLALLFFFLLSGAVVQARVIQLFRQRCEFLVKGGGDCHGAASLFHLEVLAITQSGNLLPGGCSAARLAALDRRVEDFSEKGNIIQLGYEPVRIDILTSLKGLDFSDIWEKRIQGPYGNQMINFIDRQNLIKSKRLSNRTQDRADLEVLQSDE